MIGWTAARRGNRLICLAFTVAVVLPTWFGSRLCGADELPAAKADVKATVGKTVKPFLRRYCQECHGASEQKGDRRFDQLAAAISDDDSLVDYQDIVDLLNLGEMPPEDSQQPTDQERRAVVGVLTRLIDEYHQGRKRDSHTALRRLNSREYRNTVRDLLFLDVTRFDPTDAFPRDQTTEHLDNVADTLVTSGHLLARYLEAADQVIEKAMSPAKRPRVQTWTFRDGFRQQPEIDQVHRKTNQYRHMTLYDVVGADKHEGAYGPIHAFAEGVPEDGYYEIRLRAEAVNRLHPYDPEFLGTDPSEPLRLGIVAGDHTAGNLHLPQPNEPLLAELDLEDKVQWYSVRVWLDRGITPRFTFENGLMDARNLWAKLLRKYPEQFPKNIGKGIVAARYNAIRHGKLPQIHIHEIEIEGPFYESWPTASQRELLGDQWQEVAAGGDLTEEEIRAHLQRFLSRVYRRPATSEQIDRIAELIAVRRKAGRDPLQAYGDGLKASLCSPHFLYLRPSEQGTLDAYHLASRLSYFLWASMPDETLMALAADGSLLRDDVLEGQVERMLQDRRSDGFVDGFLASWLTLRDLGATPPDRGDFRAFYHYHLDRAMRQETRLFFRHLLEENLDVGNLIDSDFTFVNKALARHYGIEPTPEIVESPHTFHRVSLKDPRRGGLLGQASVLTVTANGIDTSPVVRGVWLLENVLGTPPSPPPPDVEPLDPDTRGAKSIRDQLNKHRQTASCNDCHRKIDPLGFALENFDPIGRWRDEYRKGIEIDASGELPGGRSFDDVVGLKAVLLQQRRQFEKALVEKLLAYGMGRHVQPADRPDVDKILGADRSETVSTGGNGLRDLLKRVVLSPPFRAI